MELFQSSLLHYWEHDPEKNKADDSETSEDTKIGHQSQHEKEQSGETLRSAEKAPVVPGAQDERTKRVPVIFFDEAHKLCVFTGNLYLRELVLNMNWGLRFPLSQTSAHPLPRGDEVPPGRHARAHQAGPPLPRRARHE